MKRIINLAILFMLSFAATAGWAQFGFRPDTEFSPAGLDKQMVDSMACTGFWRQANFKCWPIHIPVYVAHAKSGDNKAVVFVTHGSGGLDKRHSDYARYLADNGITAAVMGHWEARGVTKIHFDYNKARTQGADGLNQTLDAIAVAGTFKQRPEYQNAKFGFLGESMGGTVAINLSRPYMYQIVNEVTALPKKDNLFDAAVGLYAGCIEQKMDEVFKPVPTLLVTGEKDADTPVITCQQQVAWMNTRGATVEPLVVLPGAHHDFDAPYSLLYNSTAENPAKCRAIQDKGQYTLVHGGKTFPATFDGLQNMRRECMEKGVPNGNNGNPKTGYDVWLAYFKEKLLLVGSAK